MADAANSLGANTHIYCARTIGDDHTMEIKFLPVVALEETVAADVVKGSDTPKGLQRASDP